MRDNLNLWFCYVAHILNFDPIHLAWCKIVLPLKLVFLVVELLNNHSNEEIHKHKVEDQDIYDSQDSEVRFVHLDWHMIDIS